MQVTLANPRGFCAGVNMAIECLDEAIRIFGSGIYVYHEIVHNKHVGNRFIDRGVTVGDCTSHADVHGHDEVVGTMGEAPESITLVETPEDVDLLPFAPEEPIAFLTQTTLSVSEAQAVIDRLIQRFPDIASPPKEDICYATTNRQEAVRQLSETADVVIVLGSQNSSNSLRLAELGEGRTGRAYLVDSVDELPDGWNEGVARVVVTAGASAPEDVVTDCLDHLKSAHGATVDEITVSEEHVHFPLPRELRVLQSDAGSASHVDGREADRRQTDNTA